MISANLSYLSINALNTAYFLVYELDTRLDLSNDIHVFVPSFSFIHSYRHLVSFTACDDIRYWHSTYNLSVLNRC